jgi:ceramide glucosyltransferase
VHAIVWPACMREPAITPSASLLRCRMVDPIPSLILLGLVAGSLVYALMTILAAADFVRARPGRRQGTPPISILKPLSGVDDGLECNLHSFFAQQYPAFEILLAVRDANDPAVTVVEKLRREFPAIETHLIVTGRPPYANAKVFALDAMVAAARHDLLLMADSDVRVSPGLLETMASEFENPRVGLITCAYRAVAGRSFWTGLEAIGLNSEFLGGVLVARMLNGMDFALGPTIAVRRRVLQQIGGFDYLKDYLAEDFVMGKRVAEAGWRVLLSSEIIEHRIGSQDLGANLRHRLRWARSTRRSRPAGYIGQLFTHPLPMAVLCWILRPDWWPLAVATLVARAVSAWATAGWVLGDPIIRRKWWLVPVQDVLSLFVWVAGFFGNTVVWRGRTYEVAPDGTFELKH